MRISFGNSSGRVAVMLICVLVLEGSYRLIANPSSCPCPGKSSPCPCTDPWSDGWQPSSAQSTFDK